MSKQDNETNHNNPYVGLVRGKQWERTEISDYYCGRCGWKVTDHDSYCPECGGALHKASNKPNRQFDVLKTAKNVENATPKNEIHNFDDTREQLEADIRRWATDGRYGDYYSDEDIARFVIRLLDRQAAITRRECSPEAIDHMLNTIGELEENVAELTAELYRERKSREHAYNKLNKMYSFDGKRVKQLNKLTAERDILEAKLAGKPECEICDRATMLVEIEGLTAERDELQAAIDAMNNGQFYSMYKAKCEECEQLKKVVRTQAESFKKLECELAGKDG